MHLLVATKYDTPIPVLFLKIQSCRLTQNGWDEKNEIACLGCWMWCTTNEMSLRGELQQNLFDQMIEKQKGIVFATMGSGKSFLAVLSAKELSPEGVSLIIVPKSLLSVWKGEVFEEHFNCNRVLYYHSEYDDPLNYTSSDFYSYDFVVTTYDVCVAFSKKKGSGLFEFQWDNIYCDESQRFSNPKTQLFSAMLKLNGCRKWCLSGTPVKNGKNSEIWTQLRFCEVVNCTEHEWSVMSDVKRKSYVKTGLIEPDSNETSTNRQQPYQKETTVINVTLSEEEAEFYEIVLPLLKAIVNSVRKKALPKSNTLSAITAARLTCISPQLALRNSECTLENARMRKFKNIFDDDDYVSSKFSTVKNMLDSILGKTVIFSSFSSALELLNRALIGKEVFVIDGSLSSQARADVSQDFQDADDDAVLLMTYSVGSEGWNFPFVRNIIHLDPFWNNAVHNQATSRACRPGQRYTVQEYFVIVENSIENKIRAIANKKDSKNQSILSGKSTDGGITAQELESILF